MVNSNREVTDTHLTCISFLPDTRQPLACCFRPSLSWIVGVVLLLPVTPLARVFGFTTMPLSLYGAIIGVVACYVVSAEGGKALVLSDVQEIVHHPHAT